MLQLTKKPSRCQGIWGQTVSLGLCERTHMRDPIWHLSLLSHQRHNSMLRNRNFHARTLTRTWIRRQLRKWLQAAQPKSYKPADKTEQQEAITDFTQERCRCCLGGTERNVFLGGWRILQQDRKHNRARAWKADGGKSLYLSDEGVANRGALPPAAQNALHVSCRVGKYQQAQTWDLIVQRWSLGAFPHNLCWLQALQRTESALWRGPQRERRQGLPTSLPGPSSQAGWGRCQEWRCRMEVAVVTAGGSCHTWGGAAHPRKVGDCQV